MTVMRERRAQATVEMAVVLPVLLVLGLITSNLMRFAVAVARFDRVAPDIVVAQGISPEGDGGAGQAALEAVRGELATAMEGYGVDVEVTVEDRGFGSEETFSLAPLTRSFTCSMAMTPWPSVVEIAGVSLGAPTRLRHERTMIVDPWKPGVVA